PESPWMSGAISTRRTSGRSDPAYTGTSSRPLATRTLCAFRVILSSVWLPPTVVMPRRSIAGWASASIMATASSCPGSQSRMIGRGSAMVLLLMCAGGVAFGARLGGVVAVAWPWDQQGRAEREQQEHGAGEDAESIACSSVQLIADVGIDGEQHGEAEPGAEVERA